MCDVRALCKRAPASALLEDTDRVAVAAAEIIDVALDPGSLEGREQDLVRDLLRLRGLVNNLRNTVIGRAWDAAAAAAAARGALDAALHGGRTGACARDKRTAGAAVTGVETETAALARLARVFDAALDVCRAGAVASDVEAGAGAR